MVLFDKKVQISRYVGYFDCSFAQFLIEAARHLAELHHQQNNKVGVCFEGNCFSANAFQSCRIFDKILVLDK